MLTIKILFRHVFFFFWVHTAETRSTWHTEKLLAPSLLPPAVGWKHGVLVGGVSVRFLKSRVSDESWMILFYSWMSAAFLSVGSGLVSVLFLTTPSVVCVCVCVQDGGQRKGKGVGRSERGSQQPRSWPRALQAELVTLRKAKLKNNREANCILWLWLLYGC